jgi:hypothetical protein
MNINFLWVGSRLNKLSQLGLKSFLDHGHNVVLWVYDRECENIPSGIEVQDAGQIIHPDKVFYIQVMEIVEKVVVVGFLIYLDIIF